MKKIMCLFTVIAICFLTTSFGKALAYDTCSSSNRFVPCTWNNRDFDTYIFGTGWGDVTIFYRSDCAHVGHEINASEDIFDVVVNSNDCQSQCTVYGWGNCQGGASLAAPIVEWIGAGAPNQLTVTLNPSAGGTVASSPGSLTCTDGVCTGNFSGNVQLTATAADGWEFGFWVEGENNDTTNPKTVSMTAAKEMKAVFKLLSFPLAGYSVYDAPVSSVFDHAATAEYTNDADDHVETFKGEISDNVTYYPTTTCYAKDSNHNSAFGLGFNYTGVTSLGGVNYLCYNGHPGYDYAVNTVNVYSTASGIVVAAGNDSCLGNYVEIEHTGGFTTKYFHLASINTSNVQVDQYIDSGILIGVSGNTGSCSSGAHLHFQVENSEGIPVDPYGWQGTGSDPYTRATNYNLWK